MWVTFNLRGNSIKKVSSFDIQIHQNKIVRLSQKIEPVNSSVLSTGNWYKIGVTETGLHKLDAYFLSSMGVNVANINPNEIKIYGYFLADKLVAFSSEIHYNQKMYSYFVGLDYKINKTHYVYAKILCESIKEAIQITPMTLTIKLKKTNIQFLVKF